MLNSCSSSGRASCIIISSHDGDGGEYLVVPQLPSRRQAGVDTVGGALAASPASRPVAARPAKAIREQAAVVLRVHAAVGLLAPVSPSPSVDVEVEGALRR